MTAGSLDVATVDVIDRSVKFGKRPAGQAPGPTLAAVSRLQFPHGDGRQLVCGDVEILATATATDTSTAVGPHRRKPN